MRTRIGVISPKKRTNEDSPEERRKSLRKRIRTDYASLVRSIDSDSESDNEVEEVTEEEREEENSEEPVHRWAQWDVTCGTKKGILHVENLERGLKNCIESEGLWLSPSEFEAFGGKKASKKWKQTIVYKNQPLNFWIDRRLLKSPTSVSKTASPEPSNHKWSHAEESVEENVEEERTPADMSEEQTDDKNEEQTNGHTFDVASYVSMREPMLILHKLETLNGDFHLLLNEVLLQNGKCESSEKQGEEENELSEDPSPEPVEDSETQEETILYSDENENDEECKQTEDDVSTKEQAIGTSPQEAIKKEIQIDEPMFELEESGSENCVLLIEKSDDELNSFNETGVITDAEVIMADLQQVQEQTSVEVETTEQTSTESATEHLEEEAVCVEDHNTEAEKEQTITESAPEEQEIPEGDTEDHLEVEHTCGEADDTEATVKQTSTEFNTEAQEKSDVIADDLDVKRFPNSAVDEMNFEELKREHMKWKMNVLKLQAEYYSLQIQKLKQ